MSEALAKALDFELAWQRVKADIDRRVFIRYRREVALIEIDLPGWLKVLRGLIERNEYNPSPMVICEVPKGRGALRPGAVLSIRDRVVYTACVGACLERIQTALAWSQGTVDYGHQLSKNHRDPEWMRSRFKAWEDFREQSLKKLAQGYPYVVHADISGFYDNIAISLLISDLRQVGAPEPVVQLISTCLNRWGLSPGRGVPQGLSPSDILAKLYLNSVDQNLKVMGFEHYRYVDDFRIFCKDRVQAKRALAELTKLLWKRGLSLQTAKSEIFRADEARAKIEGVLPVLKTVAQRFVEEVVKSSGLGDPYMSLPKAEKILIDNPQAPPLELIREAYKAYFIDSDDLRFDHTLFRFLLNRLATHADDYAVEHCTTFFEKHPEETHTLLHYFGAVDAFPHIEDRLVRFLGSQDAVYPYQLYQIVESLCEEAEGPSIELVAIIRQYAFDNSLPAYLRSVSRQFLGEFGEVADLERLEASYAEAGNALEQSEVICSLVRMERGRRNAFLARAERDGELNKRAAAWVRGHG